ncbi:hypothetical protein EYW49_01060 [Siculibacillus lacustris]|uniref:SnoaL-like domain-containing protein n=1 Tax=Siculibacillus lacustris TaxID=1549641 RepID=A0A4Q9VYT6_9HYPH|nr:nuclear transport factor 2 family protein [Siculibacillus lacustris]TBW41344.1 hypothetical protein EYW49_01060 [Siculibacillus lacustris]
MRADPDLVEAFYAAYNAHDAAAAVALYAEDGRHREQAGGQTRQGAEALATGLTRFFGLMPDAHWDLRERIEAGASVAVVYTLTGHLAFDLGGAPTRGLAIELPGVFVFEIADERIAATTDFWNPADFQRQLKAVAS